MKIRLVILTLCLTIVGVGMARTLQLKVKAARKGLSFGLQAHRGLSHRFPENTELAFREAGKVGIFFGMETDVQMSSDGVLVCMHDDTLDRTTDGTGYVADYTFAELQRMWIDGGNGWDERYAKQLRIPTFECYLDICREAGLVPYVELKLLTEEGVRKTIEMLHDKGFRGRYVLSSFHWNYLKEAAKYSKAPLEHMKGRWTNAMIDSLKGVKNCVIRPSAKHVTKEFVDYCHANGLAVECYGIPVGDKSLVSKLRSLDIKGGTCNDWQGLGLE